METVPKKQIKGIPLKELRVLMRAHNQPAYRADQIFNWLYNKTEFDFNRMENIPKKLRKEFSNKFQTSALQLIETSVSCDSSTVKYLFKTYDENKIESVVIPDSDRRALCVSTQAGCPLECKFCATGLMGFKRNLSSAEIVDQYARAAIEQNPFKITNLVYMGMGEPLLNYDETLKSLEIFIDELATGLGRSRITISTSGIPRRIIDLADSGFRVKLALSLHSCDNEIRSAIMPINKKYPLKDNIEAVKYYAKKTGSRITYEYLTLKGINDRKEDVNALAKLCNQTPSKVNLIPFNSLAHMSPSGLSAELIPMTRDEINSFASALRKKNVSVFIRKTQGNDIAAACGQLAAKQ